MERSATAATSAGMSTHVIVVDLAGLAFVIVGFHMAFRQALVRRWWRGMQQRPPDAPQRPVRPQEEDPAHYALLIFGMMMLAFGLIIIGFTTSYALMT